MKQPKHTDRATIGVNKNPKRGNAGFSKNPGKDFCVFGYKAEQYNAQAAELEWEYTLVSTQKLSQFHQAIPDSNICVAQQNCPEIVVKRRGKTSSS